MYMYYNKYCTYFISHRQLFYGSEVTPTQSLFGAFVHYSLIIYVIPKPLYKPWFSLIFLMETSCMQAIPSASRHYM